MNFREAYPNIYKAALAMAYDNGGIYRGRSEEQQREEMDAFMARQTVVVEVVDLQLIDQFIGTLSNEDLQTLVAGEETEMKAVQERCVVGGHCGQLLDAIFDEVC